MLPFGWKGSPESSLPELKEHLNIAVTHMVGFLGQELDSMIPMCPSQVRIFYYSVIQGSHCGM